MAARQPAVILPPCCIGRLVTNFACVTSWTAMAASIVVPPSSVMSRLQLRVCAVGVDLLKLKPAIVELIAGVHTGDALVRQGCSRHPHVRNITRITPLSGRPLIGYERSCLSMSADCVLLGAVTLAPYGGVSARSSTCPVVSAVPKADRRPVTDP